MEGTAATAPGKIILFGEHAVVYGQPAIAVPLSGIRARAVMRGSRAGQGVFIVAANLGRTIVVREEPAPDEHALAAAVRVLVSYLGVPLPDAQILLHSSIPVASGLGSGAAATAALMRCLSQSLGYDLTEDQLNPLVYEIEKLHHGCPSGIDNTVVVYERPVYFVRERAAATFRVGRPVHLLVADTGQASPTRLAVDDVRRLHDAEPARIDAVFAQIGAIAEAARSAIEQGDAAQLGILARQNQACLRDLTVSSPELDQLIAAAEAAGAAGAKLSGGGRGGNMIAFIADESAARVRQALYAAGAKRVIATVLE